MAEIVVRIAGTPTPLQLGESATEAARQASIATAAAAVATEKAEIADAIDESLRVVTAQTLGVDDPLADQYAPNAGNTYLCLEPSLVNAPPYHFEVWARTSGTVKLMILSSSFAVLGSVDLAVVGGQNNVFEAAALSSLPSMPIGGYMAVYSATLTLASRDAVSGAAWCSYTGLYAGTGSFGAALARRVQARLELYSRTDRLVTGEAFTDVQDKTDALTHSSTGLMGRRGNPVVGAGAITTNTTYFQFNAIPKDGTLDTITIYAAAPGTVRVWVSDVGGAAARTPAIYQDVAVPTTGLQTLAVGIPVRAGQVVGINGPNIITRTTSSVADDGGWASVSGNSGSGTHTLANTVTRLEIQYHFSFSEQTVTDERLGASLGRNYYDYDTTSGYALNTEDLDYCIPVIGQSYAIGVSDNAATAVSTSPEHAGYALMPNVGVVPVSGVVISSYADLKEQDSTNLQRETICTGMVGKIMERINATLGRKPRIISFACGASGNAYAGPTQSDQGVDLKRGSLTYRRLVDIIQRMAAISKASGRRLVVPCMAVLHGEQDYNNGLSQELYMRALDQWRMHLDEDVRRVTGQSMPLRFYVSQSQRGGTTEAQPAGPSLAQLAIEARNPMIRCVGPFYAASASPVDNTHLQPVGYRRLGRQFGYHIAEDMFGPYTEAMRAKTAWKTGASSFAIQYDRAIAIEADDSKVKISTLGAGKGISFTDGSGTPPAITGIALLAGTTDTVQVTLASAPTGGRWRAFVAAWREGNGTGYDKGTRSGIRSVTSIDTDPLDSFVNYEWAPQQVLEIMT